MSSQDRARSPSAGQRDGINLPSAAQPHAQLDLASSSYTDTTSSASYNGGLGAQQTYDPTLSQDSLAATNYLSAQAYASFPGDQQKSQPHQSDNSSSSLTNHTFLQSQGLDATGDPSSNFNYGAGGDSINGISTGNFNPQASLGASDSSAFPSFGYNQSDSLDPSLLADLDQSNIDLLQPQPGFANSGPVDPMATTQSSATTPPHLLPEMARRQSNSPSPNTSPNPQQGPFPHMMRQRAPSESLDPSSAMYPPPGQNEWSNVNAWRGHRHTPSDAYSDVSSHSNHASPYMPTLDSFEGNAHSSPLLNGTQDPVFNDGLGLGHFSLNDNHAPPSMQFNSSPGHSPHISPQLSPQQPLPPFTSDNNYGLIPPLDDQYPVQQQNGLEMFPGMGQEPFPVLTGQKQGEVGGHADGMSPPQINIDYAPPSRNPVEQQSSGHDDEALSPPLRSPSRNRMRAKSDSYAGSRPSSPALIGRGRSPSLQPTTSSDNLSPFYNGSNPSRSPSPSPSQDGGRSSSKPNRGRSSSNASDHRNYVLDLADPARTPSSDNNRRQQRHPANFQCTLCPKKFTRAYNLRSHLRTHTDERPFVCTVCGKAFARQHDRKRHEGLHSGEKKFVCRGALQSGAQWGCGRRFARADALGRHFRSEAGRVCIKPLLDEEAAERQRNAALNQQQQQQQQHDAHNPGAFAAQSQLLGPQQALDMSNFFPAALLQQYPSLAGIDWNAIPQGPLEDEYSGRSSYDASSGGEFLDDLSDGEIPYQDQQMSGMSHQQQQQQQGMQQQQQAPAVGGAQQGYGGTAAAGAYGNQAGDYLSDFEGR